MPPYSCLEHILASWYVCYSSSGPDIICSGACVRCIWWGTGPPGTNYQVMKRAFEEGWGGVIAKTVSLDSSKVSTAHVAS